MPEGSAAAGREFVLDFVSPDIRDILFYEIRDQRLPKYKNPPAPGTAHWDKTNYPNHVFLTRTTHAEKGWVRDWYAAKREDQDDYNYEFSYPYAGLKFCPRITRTYIELRSDYETNGPLDKGSPDPADPLEENEVPLPGDDSPFIGAKLISEVTKRLRDNRFDAMFVVVQRVYDKVPTEDEQDVYNAEITYPYNSRPEFPRYTRKYVIPRQDALPLATGTADRVYDNAVLITQRRDRFEDSDLDSIYVLVTRVFDEIPDLGDSATLDIFKTFGYRLLRPHGTTATYRIIWSFPISYADFSPEADNAACPITGYTGLELTDEEITPQADSDRIITVVRTYDDLPGVEIDTVTQRVNAGIPEKFIQSSILTETGNRVVNGTAPDAVSGKPTDLGGATIQSSVAPEQASKIREWKTTIHSDITEATISGEELDPLTGVMIPWSQELVAPGTSGTDIQADGTFSEVTPVNPAYSIKTTRKSTSLAGSSRTYYTIVNHYWPPVLLSINFNPVDRYIEAGGGDTYLERYRIDWQVKDFYNGPCQATVTESWHQTAPSQEVPTQMIPEKVVWEFILTSQAIPATLHPAFSIQEIVGSNHPNYPPQSNTKFIDATNYTDWPATIIKSIEVTPFRRGGGFLKRKVVVSKPA